MAKKNSGIIEEQDVSGQAGQAKLPGGASFSDILRGAVESAFPEVGERYEAERQRQFDAAQNEANRAVSSKAFRAFQDRLKADVAKAVAIKEKTDLGKLDDEVKFEESLSNLDPEAAASLRQRRSAITGGTAIKTEEELNPNLKNRSLVSKVKFGAERAVKAISDFSGEGPSNVDVGITGDSDLRRQAGLPQATGGVDFPGEDEPQVDAVTGADPGLGVPPISEATAMRNVFTTGGVPTPTGIKSEAMQRQAPAQTTVESLGLTTPQQQSQFSNIEKGIPGIRGFMTTPESQEVVTAAIKAIGSTQGEHVVTVDDIIKILKEEFGVK